MIIKNGNIWDYWTKGYYIVIPTNGCVKKDGSCVMGRGLALQAKQRIHNIEYLLGSAIKNEGNKCYLSKDSKIITFPVKHNWWEKADLSLIEQSVKELKKLADGCPYLLPIILPKVGCGNGKLNWLAVKIMLEKYLDNGFIIVDIK